MKIKKFHNWSNQCLTSVLQSNITGLNVTYDYQHIFFFSNINLIVVMEVWIASSAIGWAFNSWCEGDVTPDHS